MRTEQALMLEAEDGSQEATVGGRPLAPPGGRWPTCRSCGSAMQFLAQLPLRECEDLKPPRNGQILLLFQCQHNPGLCEEWDPLAGGNAALVVEARGCTPLAVPPGETLLPAESRLRFVPYAPRAGDTTDDAYASAVDEPNSRVVGKLGGQPLWMQGDETPKCKCRLKMSFVGQLESRGGGGINFGDAGAGYAFVCSRCANEARFLWQCS